MHDNINDRLSIIVPVYNEELAIGQVILGLLEQCEDAEIIVVNDGSFDATCDRLKKFNIKVITHRDNKGYGAAIKIGIGRASRQVICIMDGDNTYHPLDIKKLTEFINEFDMIVGARANSAMVKMPFHQRIAKRSVCLLLNLIFKQKIFDINSGLRLFKKDTVEKYLSILPDGFSFTASITLAMLLHKQKIKYVPINYSERIGKTKVKIFNYTMNFIKSYWRIIYNFKLKQIYIRSGHF